MAIKVTVINSDECKQLLTDWGKFASVCYDTKSTNYESIGKHCLETHHFSGSRSVYIKLKIEDCPRLLIDQLVRHEQGVVKNVQSFRYVDKNNFSVSTPLEIQNDFELKKEYDECINHIKKVYSHIQNHLITIGFSKERANEQARYILPMATNSSVCIGFTLEALIHFCNLRLCVRTEDIHRELAEQIRNAVLLILPELKDSFVPNCKYLLWCPEGKNGCGLFPTKEELQNKLKELKN